MEKSANQQLHIFQFVSGHGGQIVDDVDDVDFGDVDCGELEALIVVRDKGGRGQTQCTTSLVPDDEDGDHV